MHYAIDIDGTQWDSRCSYQSALEQAAWVRASRYGRGRTVTIRLVRS